MPDFRSLFSVSARHLTKIEVTPTVAWYNFLAEGSQAPPSLSYYGMSRSEDNCIGLAYFIRCAFVVSHEKALIVEVEVW
jgi:hypothetical protein